ncbi:hypothetical protein GJAV_G00099470 [Gymnothorax javanicus]|nr:hypothetical protein GJAV_G00099470 [Gymnothorax javanicus]
MAESWQEVVIQQAESVSSRLRELLSSGVGLLRSELGVDLGLKPELYPSWVILLTAGIGFLVVVFVWAAACNGSHSGKNRGARVSEESSTKDLVTKAVKTEDQKKRNRKKPVEKKTQPNGRTLPELHETDMVNEEMSKPSRPINEKAKKTKKKSKSEVKHVLTSSPDGKEPDEGAWETKVSNREKRQQRRKDKPPGDESGSPGGLDPAVRASMEQPAIVAPAGLRKTRGEPSHVKHGKGDSVMTQASVNWSETPEVNGGSWADMPVKLPAQMSSLDGEKWPNILKDAPLTWGQETAGSWSGFDGRVKDLNPIPLPALGLNISGGEPVSQAAADIKCLYPPEPAVDDEWSGLNGMGGVDPSSDWNAPSELWGNYEEPQLVSATPQMDSTPEAKASDDDEKEKEEASSAAGAKSKKKKKKKKKPEDAGVVLQDSMELEKAAVEETRPTVQETVQSGTPTAVHERVSVGSISQKSSSQVPPRLPVPETLAPTAKQNSTPLSSQKKSDESWEPPKQVQKKKKARRET